MTYSSSAPTGAVPGRHRAAVSAAFLGNGFLVGSWAPQIPVFAERLSLSPSELGLMILLFGIGAVAAMPVLGRVIGRTGSRGPMLAMHFAMVPALPLIALAPNVLFGVPAAIFLGLVTGGLDIAMNANAVALEKRLPKAIMSSCHGFWSVGGLVGAAFGGLAIAAVGPVLHALGAALIILLLGLIVQKGALADRPPPHAQGAETATSGRGRALGPILKAFAIGFFALFAMIPEGAAIDWSAVYLRNELGAGAASSGFAFAAFSLSMATLRFLGDAIRDRLGAVATTRFASLAAIVGLLLVGLTDAMPTVLAGFAIMGIGLSNMVPIAFSAAGNVEGLRPGTGLSIVTGLGYSGILVAPSAIGFVAERTSFSFVFASLAGLLTITFIAANLVAVADRKASAPSGDSGGALPEPVPLPR